MKKVKPSKNYKRNALFLKGQSEKYAHLFHSICDVCFLSGRVGEVPDLGGLMLQDLIDSSQLAPLGKGDKTVLDTTLRKVMQTDKVKVEWKELNSVLREIQQTFYPDVNLRAEFYKLLIYSQGDFFEKHRDTKKGEGHVLTLAVDCGFSGEDLEGGEVTFYNSKENPTTWTSKGEWACWFTQIYHSVSPILRGHRVIATYNLFLDSSPAPKKPRSTSPASLEPPSLNNDLWDKILYYCTISSPIKQSSQYFHKRYRKEQELMLHLQYDLSEIKRAMNENGDMRYLGFLLNHSYCFTDTGFMAEMDSHDLIGMDRALGNGLERLGLKFKVVRAHLVLEEDEEEPDENPFFRIASHIEDPISQDLSILRNEILESKPIISIPPQYRPYFNNQQSLNLQESYMNYYNIFSTETEYDGDLNHCSFPFYGVVWCEEMELLRKRHHKLFEGGESNLWGNAGTFAVNWYQTAVMLVEISNVPQLKCSLAQDFN